MPKELRDAPLLPDNAVYIWNHWADIHRYSETLTWSVLADYCKVIGVNLSRFEIDLILGIESLYIEQTMRDSKTRGR